MPARSTHTCYPCVRSVHEPRYRVCIAIHRKLHTVLRCLAVQMRTVFGSAPCLKLSVYRYTYQQAQAERQSMLEIQPISPLPRGGLEQLAKRES